MKKTLLLFLVFTLFSCKEKTYVELEAEVLCDVLPQLAHEVIITKLPPPPPPEDFEKYNYKSFSTEDYVKLKEIQKDSIKLLANEKHKLFIGINHNLFSINSKNLKFKNKFKVDTLSQRKLKNNELEKSKVKFKFFEPDSIKLKGDFVNDEDISSLISTSRVLFNSSSNEAFFELYPFGCMPCKMVIISKKKNNKWILKEIIREDNN